MHRAADAVLVRVSEIVVEILRRQEQERGSE